jgi:hypothetical protein
MYITGTVSNIAARLHATPTGTSDVDNYVWEADSYLNDLTMTIQHSGKIERESRHWKYRFTQDGNLLTTRQLTANTISVGKPVFAALAYGSNITPSEVESVVIGDDGYYSPGWSIIGFWKSGAGGSYVLGGPAAFQLSYPAKSSSFTATGMTPGFGVFVEVAYINATGVTGQFTESSRNVSNPIPPNLSEGDGTGNPPNVSEIVNWGQDIFYTAGWSVIGFWKSGVASSYNLGGPAAFQVNFPARQATYIASGLQLGTQPYIEVAYVFNGVTGQFAEAFNTIGV